MPYEEYLKWGLYLKRYPIGWREDERTFKLLQASGVKAKAEQLFVSLATKKTEDENSNDASLEKGMIHVNNLKRSALFLHMAGATGGDRLFD